MAPLIFLATAPPAPGRKPAGDGGRADRDAQTRGDRKSDQAANLPLDSQAGAATKLNVSERSVRSARVVLDQAEPEVVKLVEDGKMAVSAAVAVARATPEANAHRIMININ